MANFFCIEITTDAGETGFVCDTPDGLRVSIGVISKDLLQFDKPKDADDFIRKHKMNNGKARARVRDIEYISKYMMGKGVKALDEEVYYIESEEGHKVFFDVKQQGYYLDKKEGGFCCWKTKEDTENFIREMDFPIKLKSVVMKPKKL